MVEERSALFRKKTTKGSSDGRCELYGYSYKVEATSIKYRDAKGFFDILRKRPKGIVRGGFVASAGVLIF